MLFLGMDGMDSRYVKQHIDELPTLARFMNEGSMARVSSVEPALTPPCWTSIYTGVFPRKHGITGWVWEKAATERAFMLSDLKMKLIWEILSDNGFQVGCVHLPMTYPARAVDGFMISGVPTPWVAKDGGRIPWRQAMKQDGRRIWERMSHPKILADIAAEYPVDISDLLGPAQGSPECEAAMEDIIKGRLELVGRLVANRPVDVLAVGFMMIDRCYHYVIKRGMSRGEMNEILLRWYKRADGIIKELMEKYEADDTVIVSDHGGGPKKSQKGDLIAWHRPHAIFAGLGKSFGGGWHDTRRSIVCVAPTLMHIMGVDKRKWAFMGGGVANEILG